MPAEAFFMLDGSGQRPLHQAVKQFRHDLVGMLIRHNPALLHMENAMGQTPLELAESVYTQHVTTHPPEERYMKRQNGRKGLGWNGRGWEMELKEGLETREYWKRETTWKVCRDGAGEMERRKLVSVSEAGEVARRLAEREKKRRLEAEEKARKEVEGL